MGVDSPFSDMNANTATGAAASSEPTENKKVTQTGESKNVINNGDLPWAPVTLPTTSAGQSGIGNNKHNLQPETWVVGFFADGDDCQQPIITGVLPGGPGAGTGFGGDIGSDGVTPIIAGGENVEKAYNYLTQVGYTAEQAAGIIGCLQSESGSDLNPGAYNPNDLGKASFGIAQWRGPRMQAVVAFARARGLNPSSLGAQLQFLVHELRNKPGDTGNAEKFLRNASNPKDAAAAFINFEKPKGAWNPRLAIGGHSGTVMSDGGTKRRIQQALGVYQRMKGKGITTQTVSTQARPGEAGV